MGSPEIPANSSDDVQQPPFNEGLIVMNSDSEEEDFVENDGYMLLSQSAVNIQPDTADDSDDSSGSEEYLDAECDSIPAEVEDEVSSSALPGNDDGSPADSAQTHTKTNFDVGTSTELRELWSAPTSQTDIDLDADKVQAVREAMSGITLPASAIPEWAARVPEDQWRQQIMDRIQEFKAA